VAKHTLVGAENSIRVKGGKIPSTFKQPERRHGAGQPRPAAKVSARELSHDQGQASL